MDAIAPDIDPAADNRSAIQASIDRAHAQGGGTVLLPNGPCPVGGPLELRSNVTLRGTGMITTVLGPIGAAVGPLLTSPAALSGATVEDLTITGSPFDRAEASTVTEPVRPGDPGAAAVDIGAGASFTFLRRLRLTDLPAGAIRLAGNPLDHLYLEQIVIEGCRGDGIVLDPAGVAEAVFLTEISVRSFGLGGEPGAAAVRTGGRAFISQLHVQPVESGAIGLALEPGSDHTVASNLFFGVAAGQAWSASSGVTGIQIEAALERDLLDQRLARVFP